MLFSPLPLNFSKDLTFCSTTSPLIRILRDNTKPKTINSGLYLCLLVTQIGSQPSSGLFKVIKVSASPSLAAYISKLFSYPEKTEQPTTHRPIIDNIVIELFHTLTTIKPSTQNALNIDQVKSHIQFHLNNEQRHYLSQELRYLLGILHLCSVKKSECSRLDSSCANPWRYFFSQIHYTSPTCQYVAFWEQLARTGLDHPTDSLEPKVESRTDGAQLYSLPQINNQHFQLPDFATFEKLFHFPHSEYLHIPLNSSTFDASYKRLQCQFIDAKIKSNQKFSFEGIQKFTVPYVTVLSTHKISMQLAFFDHTLMDNFISFIVNTSNSSWNEVYFFLKLGFPPSQKNYSKASFELTQLSMDTIETLERKLNLFTGVLIGLQLCYYFYCDKKDNYSTRYIVDQITKALQSEILPKTHSLTSFEHLNVAATPLDKHSTFQLLSMHLRLIKNNLKEAHLSPDTTTNSPPSTLAIDTSNKHKPTHTKTKSIKRTDIIRKTLTIPQTVAARTSNSHPASTATHPNRSTSTSPPAQKKACLEESPHVTDSPSKSPSSDSEDLHELLPFVTAAHTSASVEDTLDQTSAIFPLEEEEELIFTQLLKEIQGDITFTSDNIDLTALSSPYFDTTSSVHTHTSSKIDENSALKEPQSNPFLSSIHPHSPFLRYPNN